jgi:hypothetical protein
VSVCVYSVHACPQTRVTSAAYNPGGVDGRQQSRLLADAHTAPSTEGKCRSLAAGCCNPSAWIDARHSTRKGFCGSNGPQLSHARPMLGQLSPPLTTTLLSYLRRTILPHAASLCMPGSLRRTTAAHTSPLQPGTVRQAGAAGAAVVCRRVLAAGAAQALFLPPASQPPEDAPKTHTRPPTSLPLPHTLPPPSASAHPGALCSTPQQAVYIIVHGAAWAQCLTKSVVGRQSGPVTCPPQAAN